MERFAFKIDSPLRSKLYQLCRLCGIDNPKKERIFKLNKDEDSDDEPDLCNKIRECVGIKVTKQTNSMLALPIFMVCWFLRVPSSVPAPIRCPKAFACCAPIASMTCTNIASCARTHSVRRASCWGCPKRTQRRRRQS